VGGGEYPRRRSRHQNPKCIDRCHPATVTSYR
jgi:hypothetical protein